MSDVFTLPVDVAPAPVAGEKMPPLLPIAGPPIIASGGRTLALCARASSPDRVGLCKRGKLADGADKADPASYKWTGTCEVLDIARAFAGGLLALPE